MRYRSVIEALGDSDSGVTRAASDALVAMAPTIPDVDAALREVLRGERGPRRFAAATARGRIAPPDPSLLPAVVDAMASPEGDRRWAATRLLVAIGRLHGEGLQTALGLASAAESPSVRRMALFALRDLAPDEPAAATAMLSASQSEVRQLRHAAIVCMASLETSTKRVQERLFEALDGDTDDGTRSLAAVTLGEIASQNESTPEARERLEAIGAQTRNPALQRACNHALARLSKSRP